VLLYDLTSTYFEFDPTEDGERKFGYSRDERSDCVQVVIALIVTPNGLPLAYGVMDGNTSKKTTLKASPAKIENQYGAAKRTWVMDRGIPTEERSWPRCELRRRRHAHDRRRGAVGAPATFGRRRSFVGWRLAMLRRHLERRAEPEQVRLMIWQHDDLDPDRYTLIAEAGRDANRRHPGLRSDQCVSRERQALMLAVAHFLLGRRKHLPEGKDERIEIVLANQIDDQPLEPVAGGELAVTVRNIEALAKRLKAAGCIWTTMRSQVALGA
jgi:hypothetical protein